MASRKSPFMVTGPGVEGKPVESLGVGLSAATTFACRAKDEATYYVRDTKGDSVAHAERMADGIVYVTQVSR